MFKNYIKIALRNLLKNKVYSFITISGLTIGISICMLLLLYVQDELSYDKFNVNSDRIYRLLDTDHPFQAPQTAKLLADNFPEFEAKCNAFLKEQNPDKQTPHSYSLQALEDIHLYSSGLNNDIQPQGDITYVITFAFIGILILLIASINYINLFTSNATKRSKEIGIKKVIGASFTQILFSLTIDFVKWIVTAYIIALPIAWYIMEHWMQHFAYSINLSWGIFLLAGVIVLVIGMATISFYAVKSALTNPIDSLKYE